MSDETVEPFAERVWRLIEEKGTTLEKVALAAYDPEIRGTSSTLVKKAMRGERALNMPMIEAIADALGVEPEEFPEYQLAGLRYRLDERQVGLDEAWGLFSQLREALATAADSSAGSGAARVPHRNARSSRAQTARREVDPDRS